MDLIDEVVSSGIPHDRIILGGFSQGGAVSLYTAFSQTKAVGGVAVLSGYVPKAKTFIVNEAVKNVPVFWGHGTADPVVQFKWAEKSRDLLKSQNVNNIDWRVYPGMQHSACPEEIDAFSAFLTRILPAHK